MDPAQHFLNDAVVDGTFDGTNNSWALYEDFPLDWDEVSLLTNTLKHPQQADNHHIITADSVNTGDSKKVSDALIYGPKFCELFRAYCAHYRLNIDISRHLLALCTENLVNFIRWARESESQTSWISRTLLDNDNLRCEVRNGIVMVLVYTFASIKTTLRPESDNMFATLQDAESGLGIVNKTSLKIYNDPYYYLLFLKITISALIDAGVLPDNERVNQPKRVNNKLLSENKQEYDAFKQLATTLVQLLDRGKNKAARSFVATITAFWQQKRTV